MLTLGGITDVDPAAVLASGQAYEKWAEMIRAQGGDPEAPLPTAKHVHVVEAPSSGTLTHLDAYAVGVAAWRLGAGRARKEDPVQHAAGVLCRVKPGEPVEAGQPVLELHTDTPETIPAALSALDGQWSVGAEAGPIGARLLDIIRG
jgi:thymidine phosphorylase